MDVDNDTSTPVNYDQSTAGPGDEEPGGDVDRPPCPRVGELGEKGSGHNRVSFIPGCRPPWVVTFTDPSGGHEPVRSAPIPANQANATVTLNDDWTVSVVG